MRIQRTMKRIVATMLALFMVIAMMPFDDVSAQDINLIDIHAITSKAFEVFKDGNYVPVESLGPDATVSVGDGVHIEFQYTTLTDMKADNVYYFAIPKGITAETETSHGPITIKGKNVGSYKVENNNVYLQFDEAFLESTGGKVESGSVNIYGTINRDAISQDGKIVLDGQVIGKLPLPDKKGDINLSKVNGDATSSDTTSLVYDATKNAVQYTIKFDTNGNNTVLDTLDIKDVLTVTNDVLNGSYSDIVITPNDIDATFKKGTDGNYVLHATNVQPDKSYTVTYWVPLKAGVTECGFSNKVTATAKYGNEESTAQAQATGNIGNGAQVNKTAGTPVYHPETGKTTVLYKVVVTANSNNTTTMKDLQLKDVFSTNADLVEKVNIKTAGVKMVSDLSADGKNKTFTCTVPDLKPDQSTTIEYEIEVDSNKCFLEETPSTKELDNKVDLLTDNGKTKIDSSDAQAKFDNKFTSKEGVFDQQTGKLKFVIKFDGQIPGTNKYFDKVLQTLNDKITTAGWTYSDNDTTHPVLQAVQGDKVIKEQKLTDLNLEGKNEFKISIPKDLQGEYSYVLTYYVNVPADSTISSKPVHNSFTAQTIGIDGREPTKEIPFKSEAHASVGDSFSASIIKQAGWPNMDTTMSYSGIDYDNPPASSLLPGFKGDVLTANFEVFVSSPVTKGTVVHDQFSKTDNGNYALSINLEYLKSRLVVKKNVDISVGGYKTPSLFDGGTPLKLGEDYDVTLNEDGKGFKIVFLKAITDVSNNKPIRISYRIPVSVTEKGKETASSTSVSTNGSDNEKVTNKARLELPGLNSEWKSVDATIGGKITKSVATDRMSSDNPSIICWKIDGMDKKGSAFLGQHTLTEHIADNQEFVKIVEQRTKLDGAPEGDVEIPATVSPDGRTVTATIGKKITHSSDETLLTPTYYYVYTKVKDSWLIENGINPDDFKDVKFTNTASINSNGVDWNVSAETTWSGKRNEKTYSYTSSTQQLKNGVEFTLNINKDAIDMNPNGDKIKIHDVMNRALSLDKATLKVQDAEGKDVPYTLTYNDGNCYFDLEVPDQKALKITYVAIIEADAEETGWLSNSASIEGRYGSTTVEDPTKKKLKVGAGVLSNYNFYIKKTDGDNKAVSGAEFTMKKVTLENGQLTYNEFGKNGGKSFDNQDGTYKFKEVDEKDDSGKYVVYALEETKAPDGCKKDSKIHYVAFGTDIDANLKAALAEKNITVDQSHVGQSNNVTGMFAMKNENTGEKTKVTVTKKWEDENDAEQARPSSIKVTLHSDVPNSQDKTVTVKGTGNQWTYTFDNLEKYYTYDDTFRKEITYTVTETSQVKGYTTSDIEGNQKDGYTITNTHKVEKTSISGKKHWVDTDTKGRKEIVLGIYAGSDNTPVQTKTIQLQEGNDWAFTFDNLQKYMNGMEIRYTVKEIGTIPGYTTEVGTYKNDYTVTNTKVEPVEQTIGLSGVKTLKEGNNNKEIAADQFEFTLTEDANNPASIIPKGLTAKVTTNGTFTFDKMTFPTQGNYTFTVKETNKKVTGYTYDTKEYEVNIPVTYNSETKKLVIGEITYKLDGNVKDAIQFDNKYESPSSITYKLKGTKTLTENGQPKTITEGQFEFNVAQAGETPEKVTTPNNAKVKADGTFEFDEMTLTKEGTYTFTVTEVGQAPTGYTYDNKAVTVTVPVTVNAQNKLEIGNVTYSKDNEAKTGIEFNNTYTAASSTSVTLNGTKELKEGTSDKTIKDGQFSFELYQESTQDGVELPQKLTTSVSANGTFAFDAISFTKAGTYTFKVKETGTAPAGYTYDDKEVTVTVPVTLNANNKLEVGTITYKKGNEDATGIKFKNTYATPTETKVSLTGTKTLTQNGQAKAMTAGQFKFQVEQVGTTPATVTMPANAEVTTNGTFTFGDITLAKAGTYTFVVTEVNDGKAGYTYDNKAVTVTVPVTLNEAKNTLEVGQVTYEKEGSTNPTTIEFNNTYAPGQATLAIPVVKKIVGNDRPAKKDFTFTLTGGDADTPMPADGNTVTIKDTGNGSFGNIAYTQAGTYNYTVAETNSKEPGYTYSTDVYSVQVVVEDKDGTLEAKATYKLNNAEKDSIEFTNTYNPTDTSYVLNVEKAFDQKSHARPTKQDFTFTLTGTDADTPMPANGNTVTIKDAGTGSFGSISYSKAGTYKYTVTETDGKVAGYTYVAQPKEVEIVVVDTNGVLSVQSATWADKKTEHDKDYIVFTNSYAPQTASFVIPVSKKITGNDRPEQKETFTFTLTGGDENTPMPGQGGDTTTITDEGQSSFGSITYNKAGNYTYTVKETAGQNDTYTYSTEEYEVTVHVADVNGVLLATATYKKGNAEADKVEFTNTYTPKATSVTLPVNKVITGNERPEQKETFTFTLTGDDENTPMPGQGGDTTTITDEGQSSFGEIKYKKAGTYTYTVKETKGNATGYTYSDTEYKVTVTVVDQNGQLVATTSIKDKDGLKPTLTFVNEYKPVATSVTLPVNKVITGNERPETKEDFTFTIEGDENAPMPKNEEITITDEGQADFGEMTFIKAGTYTYTVKETQGNATGYTYSDDEYTVTVVVTDENGRLKAETTLENKAGEAEDITFTNHYEPTQTTVKLPVNKVIQVVHDQPKNTEPFEFELTTKGDAPMPDVSKCMITGEGKTSFGDITFKKAGTYTYTLIEKNTKAADYTYDTTVHEIVVTVVDNNGVLEATWSDNGKAVDSVEFVNKYDYKTPETVSKGSKPKTGDNANMTSWMAMLGLSTSALIGLIVKRKKEQE